MLGNLLNFNNKQKAAIFVDYEHWYYAYYNQYSMKPNVEEWYSELKDEYNIKELMFFGDFSHYGIDKELVKLKRFSDKIIHTASTKDGVDKDFTDFVMLDYIYRSAATKHSPDVYIIFTGDAHFNLAVQYLRDLKKRVIIYGVKKSLSNKLKSSANAYVEMPRNYQEQQYYYNLIFNTLKVLHSNNKKATYWKTITNVAEHNGISKQRIQSALDDLLSNKYLIEESTNYKGKTPKVLKADWKRIKCNGLC